MDLKRLKGLKKLYLLTGCLLFFLITKALVQADGGSYHGAASSIINLDPSGPVEIESQTINLTLLPGASTEPQLQLGSIPKIKVHADVKLKNNSNQTQTIQLGFPLKHIDPAFGNEKEIIQALEFQVLGKPQSEITREVTKEEKYSRRENLFLWKETLEPNESKSIAVYYNFNMSVFAIDLSFSITSFEKKWGEGDILGVDYFFLYKVVPKEKLEITADLRELETYLSQENVKKYYSAGHDFSAAYFSNNATPLVAEAMKNEPDSNIASNPIKSSAMLAWKFSNPLVIIDFKDNMPEQIKPGVFRWDKSKQLNKDVLIEISVLDLPGNLADFKKFYGKLKKTKTEQDWMAITKEFLTLYHDAVICSFGTINNKIELEKIIKYVKTQQAE